MRKFPEGTKFNPWKLVEEHGHWIIKRWVRLPDGRGTNERYPINKISHIHDSRSELERLVIRLNQESTEIRTKKAVDLKHAFISPDLLDRYREYLNAQIPNKEKAQSYYYWTYHYFLAFFIGKLNLPNPVQWHLVHETEWANYLTSDPEVPRAETTKKEIINAANRFMSWLHKQRPNEVPPLEFRPLSKAKIKKIRADRVLNGERKVRIHVNPEDLELILEDCGALLRPFILVSLHFGLRRAEVLGLKLADVRASRLMVERQFVEPGPPPVYDVLKGRDQRHVAYWYATPAETYMWIEHIQNNPMHPDTLTSLWRSHMKDFGMKYDFHDLRHTFLTKAVRDYAVRDVQLAAGHKDIRTTMGYVHDDRGTDDRPWKPA